MKRGIFAFVASAAMLLVAISPQRISAKIVVGISSVNVAFLPLYVTIERGFFKDEGLEIVPVMFNSGTTNLQSLIGGDVQVFGVKSGGPEQLSPCAPIKPTRSLVLMVTSRPLPFTHLVPSGATARKAHVSLPAPSLQTSVS